MSKRQLPALFLISSAQKITMIVLQHPPTFFLIVPAAQKMGTNAVNLGTVFQITVQDRTGSRIAHIVMALPDTAKNTISDGPAAPQNAATDGNPALEIMVVTVIQDINATPVILRMTKSTGHILDLKMIIHVPLWQISADGKMDFHAQYHQTVSRDITVFTELAEALQRIAETDTVMQEKTGASRTVVIPARQINVSVIIGRPATIQIRCAATVMRLPANTIAILTRRGQRARQEISKYASKREVIIVPVIQMCGNGGIALPAARMGCALDAKIIMPTTSKIMRIPRNQLKFILTCREK